ncbi:MAG: CofH family radical SAM protein [Holophagaceae bacterium]|uniref:CofH family radical SAM protein n=1 Tax=Candidatus Geothrix odensensis TaxID=2954440 RepID=A0A936EZB7_9BACT|nr:CofH family radical SAM protein [Candidatus Geothrix odensensis]
MRNALATHEDILNGVIQGRRISAPEALVLLDSAELPDLAMAATVARDRHNDPRRVSYVIDRNVNYTDVCNVYCTFCAFYHKPGDPRGYVLTKEQLKQKAEETRALGGTGFLLQGGVNPDLPWDYYLDLVRHLRHDLGIWVHGFSPVEIQMMAKLSGQTLRQTIADLREAGLGSIPGGGAEILVDRIRKKIAPLKGGREKWLEVMEAAHEEGVKTTGTMMFGITETLAERIEHLEALRSQQDRALARGNGGGYTAFAAWPFQSGHTPWEGKVPKPTDVEYLRTIAVARIYLDNFAHIQSSWVTMGRKTGQLALHYGCDDMGSLMLEENVVSAAGTCYSVNRDEMTRMITAAGYEPWQRDNIYGEVPA